MIDLHKKRPDLIQLVLIIAVVCLALGAITPSASAVEYEDLSYTSGAGEISGTVNLASYRVNNPEYGGGFLLNNAIGNVSVHCGVTDSLRLNQYKEAGSISDLLTVNYSSLPKSTSGAFPYLNIYFVNVPQTTDVDVYSKLFASWLIENTDISVDVTTYIGVRSQPTTSLAIFIAQVAAQSPTSTYLTYNYNDGDSLDFSLTAFAPDDPSGMYVLSLDGSLLDTTYTVGINRYTDEFGYLIDSYAYTDGSGSYTFTGSRSLTLPIYYNSFTNMPYSYEVSVNVNDENGYLDTRYPVYWSDLGGLYDTFPDPVLPTPIPTPTQTFIPTLPVNPSDIIPDPESLNDTVNITGWYQDSGFEGNNITAPIYNGIRGWFNENLAPVIDFFLTPTNYVATVISDSAETSTDGISYITEELGSYAAPFNTVGAYVVRLVPEVVWLVVFAALSIGYVVLLIKISTGSIRDTIGRFLGGAK